MKEICPAKCPHCPFYKCIHSAQAFCILYEKTIAVDVYKGKPPSWCRLEKIQVVEKEKA